MTTRDGLIERVEKRLANNDAELRIPGWTEGRIRRCVVEETGEDFRALIAGYRRMREGLETALSMIERAHPYSRTDLTPLYDIVRAALSDPSDQTDADLPTQPQGATWPDDAAVERAVSAFRPCVYVLSLHGGSDLPTAMRAALIAAGNPPSPEPVTEGEVEACVKYVIEVAGFAVSTRAVRAALEHFAALRLGRV